jgi:hypothetical protein
MEQHQIMIGVLNKYQRSSWPWIRWVTNQIREEIMQRCAVEIDWSETE